MYSDFLGIIILQIWCSSLVSTENETTMKAVHPDATSLKNEESCSYAFDSGVQFNLSPFCEAAFSVTMEQPKSAILTLSLKEHAVRCGSLLTAGCIEVPGLEPASLGSSISVAMFAENIPSLGLEVHITGGSICEAMPHKLRNVLLRIQCPENIRRYVESETRNLLELSAYEGLHPYLCEYTVNLVSMAGCPLAKEAGPGVTAVTGCKDSEPVKLATHGCPALGGSALTLHGYNLFAYRLFSLHVSIGDIAVCSDVNVINDWMITCEVKVHNGRLIEEGRSYKVSVEESDGTTFKVSKGVSVTFDAMPDFTGMFSDLTRYGIGGMRRQAEQIYQRVFLSRSVPAHVLGELGMTHVKGVILHGPPGTGKTLLARAIASIMRAQRVHLVSSPELLNKYVGESETNLRALFTEAESSWHQLQRNSPLHIIILDEMDAICKPRGRDTDNIGSLVYDSMVNQLLTKMDGLSVQSNVLVIGLTNRFELIDPALLRPGRFEVHIEITLPDHSDRLEILNLHLTKARDHGRLSADVDFDALARQSVGLSQAQLAGVVRHAQSLALTLQLKAGSPDETMISMTHLNAAINAEQKPASGGKLRVELADCSHVMSIQSVANSSSGLPLSSLVVADNYGIIVECLELILQTGGFHAEVITAAHVAMYPRKLSEIHLMPRYTESQKVAVIIADLCYVTYSCEDAHAPALSAFLLNMRALTLNKERTIMVVGLCPTRCVTDSLERHFSFLFGMVSAGKVHNIVENKHRTNKTTV